MYHNCPFGTGCGYGDGRAISIGELVVTHEGKQKRWELQLKGAGTTPFCRGGDGRAVLRSSVREFLASEAMHNLGVRTTRAISLVASGSELVRRPWYSNKAGWRRDPDTVEKDLAAITCRVAASFLRVGHLQLFERRVRRSADGEEKAMRMNELTSIVEHCIFREFPEINKKYSVTQPDPGTLSFLLVSFSPPLQLRCKFAPVLPRFSSAFSLKLTLTPAATLQVRALEMLSSASKKIAKMTSDWLRVGFCQGNFNSDNCLVAGRTMDYGPCT